MLQPPDRENEYPRRAFLMQGALAAGAFAAGCRTAQGPAEEDTSVDLDGWVKEAMEAEHVPGLSACYIRDGKIAWERAYGWANVDAKTPMTPDTIQNIASVSKTVTATAVMQLWQQGRFGLDDDIGRYVGFAVRNPHHPVVPISIRQLLTHTASINDGPAYDLSYAPGDPTIPLAEWLTEYFTPGGRFYGEATSFYEYRPGTKRSYSNVGFGLLGYLVEAISGAPFNEYCKNHLFQPLGMNATGWFLKEVDAANHAIPYAYIPRKQAQRMIRPSALFEYVPEHGGWAPFKLYSFPNYPDGLVRTSVRQFSRFLIANLNGGIYENASILEAAAYQEIFKSYGEEFSEPGRWQGLAWLGRKDNQGRKIWGHSGGDPGVSTIVLIRPEDGTGVAAFANGDTSVPGKLVNRLIETPPKAV